MASMLNYCNDMRKRADGRLHAHTHALVMPLGLSGYIGSSDIFDDAICDFAVEYADQAERDHKAFVKAVREGRAKAVVKS